MATIGEIMSGIASLFGLKGEEDVPAHRIPEQKPTQAESFQGEQGIAQRQDYGFEPITRRFEQGPTMPPFAVHTKGPSGRDLIGIGHNDPHHKYTGISSAGIENLFHDDMDKARSRVKRKIKTKLAPHQLEALADIEFSTKKGIGTGLKALLNEGKMAEAARFMLKYRYWHDKDDKLQTSQGMVDRARARYNVFKYGFYPSLEEGEDLREAYAAGRFTPKRKPQR